MSFNLVEENKIETDDWGAFEILPDGRGICKPLKKPLTQSEIRELMKPENQDIYYLVDLPGYISLTDQEQLTRQFFIELIDKHQGEERSIRFNAKHKDKISEGGLLLPKIINLSIESYGRMLMDIIINNLPILNKNDDSDADLVAKLVGKFINKTKDLIEKEFIPDLKTIKKESKNTSSSLDKTMGIERFETRSIIKEVLNSILGDDPKKILKEQQEVLINHDKNMNMIIESLNTITQENKERDEKFESTLEAIDKLEKAESNSMTRYGDTDKKIKETEKKNQNNNQCSNNNKK